MPANPFIAQVIPFAGNFAPRGWAFCDGQLLPISQNTALFSLIGTIYGGDGRTTLALPDLRGRAAIHPGRGPGLSTYRLGEKGGQERVTLNTLEIPQHNHSVRSLAESRGGNLTDPGGNMLASGTPIYRANTPADDVDMDPSMIRQNNVGGGQAHENRPPFQALNYIIALVGVFPSRS
ncbi:phage tail protein [Antarctobacter heliothermus]|uniref:Microcystin-dependent protein n=1 Tax=Antarctobacter heliothermus TaxID=74033 RepID=A0A239HW59_9RHOB|nr:tail fiber protein [Antarctobacter heliothermus]SNS85318.1 Microcystin-dependent protein [Antarctobacter heliothermus]